MVPQIIFEEDTHFYCEEDLQQKLKLRELKLSRRDLTKSEESLKESIRFLKIII